VFRKSTPLARFTPPLVRRIQSRLIRWGRKNFNPFPWRSTRNRFHALLAELLLQRTRAEQVVPVYRELCKRFRKPKELAAAPPNVIADIMYPLGLHWRASWLQQFAREVAHRFRPSLPADVNALDSLPGVGPYAASALVSLHAGKRAPIVDANVVRLYGRLFGFKWDGETRRKRFLLDIADRMTPRKQYREYNYAVLDFTRAQYRLYTLTGHAPRVLMPPDLPAGPPH